MRLSLRLTALACALPTALAVWPRPASMSQGDALVKIDTHAFHFHSANTLPDDLADALRRTEAAIREDHMTPLIVGRGEERRSDVEAASLLTGIQVELKPSSATSLSDEILQPVEKLDEAYELYIPSDGSDGKLSASSSLGIFRGLATFEQLVYSLPHASSSDLDSDSASESTVSASDAHLSPTTFSLVNSTDEDVRYIPGAPIRIVDRPAYPWRGLLLDTSRNFYSVRAIEHTLDAMAFVKLNTFHWHIVDAHSFPLQLPGRLGVLAQKGAYSAEEVYTPDDIAGIVEYAAHRGIRVNVEIDMPGHMYEGVVGLDPSIVVCPARSDWTQWSNSPPSGQLSLNSTAARTFATDLITATAALFPSPYFSTGGDEVEVSCYGASSASDIDATLLKPFVEAVHATVRKVGKRPLVWEEMAIQFPETGKALLNGTIVEAWTSSANVASILSSTAPGVKLIHAPSDYFYMDCGAGGWLGNAPERQSWCAFVPWQKSYSFDPLAGTEGVAGGAERVLGGEAALWSEQADEHSMDSYLWPRVGSAAEVFWTGASYKDGSASVKRSVTEALPRLHDLRFRLVDRGYGARPIQPLWCALRPGQCDLV
ncbi:hypothetical protein V8E36_003176 [Tilletia maclaganii]